MEWNHSAFWLSGLFDVKLQIKNLYKKLGMVYHFTEFEFKDIFERTWKNLDNPYLFICSLVAELRTEYRPGARAMGNLRFGPFTGAVLGIVRGGGSMWHQAKRHHQCIVPRKNLLWNSSQIAGNVTCNDIQIYILTLFKVYLQFHRLQNKRKKQLLLSFIWINVCLYSIAIKLACLVINE